MKCYENDSIYILKEEASIPWVKIFSQKPYKELSECDDTTRDMLLKTMLIVEKVMLAYYKPTKVNIALFGNYLPQVHIHVMARFALDSHFPESMWGIKQRESALCLPDFETFVTLLKETLETSL